jgi:hypothetical protein
MTEGIIGGGVAFFAEVAQGSGVGLTAGAVYQRVILRQVIPFLAPGAVNAGFEHGASPAAVGFERQHDGVVIVIAV